MGDLVNEKARGRFFGMRNKITGAVAFVSIFAAGYLLSLFTKETVLYGFTIIFLVAFAARIISWHHLSLMEDPPMKRKGPLHSPLYSISKGCARPITGDSPFITVS